MPSWFIRNGETDLQMQIDNAEADHPGYDEYRYHVGNIGHNPFELMGFLTASYQAFQYADVEAVLLGAFCRAVFPRICGGSRDPHPHGNPNRPQYRRDL